MQQDEKAILQKLSWYMVTSEVCEMVEGVGGGVGGGDSNRGILSIIFLRHIQDDPVRRILMRNIPPQ